MNKNSTALIIVILATAIVIYCDINVRINQSLFDSIVSIIVFWLLYILLLVNNKLKQVKGEYKKQKEQLHDVLEYSTNWIAYKDLHGKITGCNDVVCDFFKLPRKEIIGKNMLEYFTKEEAEKIASYEKLVIDTKKTVDYNMELKRNGDMEYFHVIKSPLLDENDNVFGISTICVNTTEEKFSMKVKELYAESLSHDFKNPILAQYKALEALKSGLIGELTTEQLEIIEQISSSCKFVEQMLNAQLASFKYSMIRYIINPTDFGLSAFINEYIEDIQPMIKGKNLSLINMVEPRINIVTDKTLVTRAIMNIIFNAIAHSAENTTFKISAQIKHSTIEFYIENYCIKGQFNQESLNQLFERFALARDRFRQVGAGIGLYIVKEIVRVLDGNLYLKVQDSDLENFDKFQIKFSIPKNTFYLKDKCFNFK